MKKILGYLLYILTGTILGGVIGLLILDISVDEDMDYLDFLTTGKRENSTGLDIHSTSPEFSLYSLEGDRISLTDYSGKPVVINFWATWCAPCVIEMPLIQQRYDQHKPDLVVLAVNAGEAKKDVVKFMEENNLSFTTLLDTTKMVQKMYHIRAYPTTYFIDSSGIIQAIHIGVLSEKEIDKYLNMIGVLDGESNSL